jgi:protein-S-isoprenylcysteine O-methyltransferase Ste14
MSTNVTVKQTNETGTTRGIVKRAAQLAAMLVLQAALLFITAGRVDWIAAWIFLGVYVGTIVFNTLVLLPEHPDLIAERAQPKANAKNWDKLISSVTGVAYLLTMIVAGLDVRLGWSSPVALVVLAIGCSLLMLGNALFSWAMASNAFFSTLVRIQDERGHAVASAGPYRWVRHPGYVGWVLMNIGMPLLFGSWWALIPGGLSAGLMVVRTALEDRTLQDELPGYPEYAAQVRYRLLPGVW